jgi:integrase
MPNKRTVALTEDQYKLIITTIRTGFIYGDGNIFKANNRLATILVLESNLGLRISDILHLSLSDIIKDGNRYRLNIVEEKTGKARTFTVPTDIYLYIQSYAYDNHINPKARLFPITERAIQKQLKIVSEYLGLSDISTHSFRKYYATEIYVNNNYNIELVRALLQHSSVAITQKYIGINSKELEDAIQKHMCLL